MNKFKEGDKALYRASSDYKWEVYKIDQFMTDNLVIIVKDNEDEDDWSLVYTKDLVPIPLGATNEQILALCSLLGKKLI